MQTKSFKIPLLSLSFLGGALLINGCNQAGTETSQVAGETTTVAQNAKSDAPEGSTTKEAQEKTGITPPGGAMSAMKPAALQTKLAFSSNPSAIPVGKPATWNLQISDAKSGDAIKEFEVEMTKQMHLIVVKNDLSWFNHIHPQFQGNGKFTVTTTLPTAGSYKIYADYTVKGIGQQVPQFEFATAGATLAPAQNDSLSVSKPQGAWLVDKFNAHPESEPDTKGGKQYEVALMPMPSPVVAGQDTMLHFQIRDAKGVPVKNLQPYLGAMGHCVILSSDTNSYLHSHPMGSDMKGMDHSMDNMKMETAAPKSGDPNVMFHTNFPKAGLYKVWGQFQHEGKIITAAFVVRAAAGKIQPQKSTGAVDEAQPHSH
ncbi:hypothetical protein B1R32_12420 [Abditibacterium utsteinense]|uniref:YtkA-like n=1 Tax=Abditibacterium utsteinense TaxID=1960156 RepID=A0A2S8SPJ9_9BACT|nr:hypothetical protein [Abditibacterium utsteinense]PQV62704.1 hypothetical protein B1R32_12420 [Abditibacterium utsteinense]